MAFGDVLKRNLNQFRCASKNKLADNAFWVILRNVAVQEILEMYPHEIDSDVAVAAYYYILSENADYIPAYFKKVLASNNQERFRVINRNMWTSNAFHPDGLANQPQISARKEMNPDRKGEKIVYKGVK